MRDYQKRGRIRRIMQSKIALAVFAVVIIAFSYTIFNLLQKMEETKRNKQIAENKVQELESRKDKLTTDIENLNTPQGVEASIRSRFGLAEEGENMIVIVDDKDNVSNDEGKSKILDFFKDWWK